MALIKPILLTAILMSVFVCTNALAQAPPVLPQPDKAARTDRPDPKKLHKRRAVVQQTYSMPPAAPPVDTYRGALIPPPPAALSLPSGPLILNGHHDPSGARLNGGIGTTLLDSNGKQCVPGPVAAQCF